MSTFLAENPDVDIELEEKISGDIVLAIRAGAADLGIVAGNIDVEGLDVMPLFRDELAIVTSLGHPLAQLESARFVDRSEEHTSELQSLMRISYAVFCLKKNKKNKLRK